MKQRSEEWFESRRGKFTASKISDLLTSGSRKMTKAELEVFKKENPKSRKTTTECIGDMLYTQAFEKAVELVFGVDQQDIVSDDIDRGVELEPVAFEVFKGLKDKEFIEVQEASFFPYGKNAGASPDGMVGKDAVLEIKCPRAAKFFKIMLNDCIEQKHYDQMQMQMLCTNSKQAHYFNYIEYNGLPMWHEIVVPRDDERIAFIKLRLETAIAARDKYVVEIKEKQQFNGSDRELAEVGKSVLQG